MRSQKSEQFTREERTTEPEGREGRREIKRNILGIKLDKIKRFLDPTNATLEHGVLLKKIIIKKTNP